MYTLVKKIDCGEFRVVGLMRMDLRWGGGGGESFKWMSVNLEKQNGHNMFFILTWWL